MRRRLSTGIHGLDSLIGGDLQDNKVYLVSSKAGTGKTVFCLQYVLTGYTQGRKGARGSPLFSYLNGAQVVGGSNPLTPT